MTKQQEVEQKIRELCPELQELSFGCEVEFKSAKVLDYNIVGNDKTIGFITFYAKGRKSYDGETVEYYGDTLEVYFPDWDMTKRWGEWASSDIPEYKIIGHPIELHYVLLAIGIVHGEYSFITTTWGNGLIRLKTDVFTLDYNTSLPFTEQEPAVFDFLHTLFFND